MLAKNIHTLLPLSTVAFKLKGYAELLKLRLSFLVVFSSGIGYMLGVAVIPNTLNFIVFLLGGFCITGAANTINQIIEVNLDKLMKRTSARPLPTGRIGRVEAMVFSTFSLITGVLMMLSASNLLATGLALLSFFLYAFVYTPMKRISSVAVLIGAIPGALPPLIGWAASTGNINMEGMLLFGIQFIWQFPHFWAIAWVLDDDYRKAGFKLLPFGGGRDINTAFQIMIYTMLLIPLGVIPAKLGFTGNISSIIITICGVIFLMQTFYLMKECSTKAARSIMFGSFLYLPIVQIALLWDKL